MYRISLLPENNDDDRDDNHDAAADLMLRAVCVGDKGFLSGQPESQAGSSGMSFLK